MKRELKLLLLSLAVAATVAFVSCGNGEPIDIDVAGVVREVEKATGILLDENTMKDMMSDYQPPSSAEEPSSSSVPPDGGTSSQTVTGTSSQSGGGTSSQSGGGTSSQSGGGTSSQSGDGTSSNNTTPPSSSSAAPKSSAQAATGCAESNPKAGFTCGWNVTGTLVPGQELKPTSSGGDGCTISWKFVDEYSTEMTQGVINSMCTATTDAGFTSEGSKNYTLYAELDCGGTKHLHACNPKTGLSSKKAPGLTGACTWDKSPTSSARGAVPSGVTLVDTDKVCGNTLPAVKYVYGESGKEWPGTKADGWPEKKDTVKYADVRATVPGCTAFDVPPVTCPILQVNGGVEHAIECTDGYEDKNCKTDGKVSTKDVNLTLDECVEITIVGYTNQNEKPTIYVNCNGVGLNGNNRGFTLSLNAVAKPAATDNTKFEIGTLKNGDNEFGTVCLTAVSGGTTVNCKMER